MDKCIICGKESLLNDFGDCYMCNPYKAHKIREEVSPNVNRYWVYFKELGDPYKIAEGWRIFKSKNPLDSKSIIKMQIAISKQLKLVNTGVIIENIVKL